jgi:hypothetical protein
MKKIKALVGAGLLASAGTMLGVTCAVDNVPAATLLVPYFKVAAPVNANYTVGAPTVDTYLAITNVSSTGLIAHVTVWNKYSAPVVDYNIAMTGYDVATWSMSQVLGGELTPNYSTHEVLARPPINLFERGLREGEFDPCGVYWPASGFPTYDPRVGWGKTTYIRFPHPLSYTQAGNTNSDHYRAISIYESKTASKNAFCPGGVPCKFQQRVLASLDEGLDVTSFTSPGARGGGILDATNYASNYPVNGANDVIAAGPAVFQGYVTIDVVNFCTNWFPDQAEYMSYDALATSGWRMECTEADPDANLQCNAPWLNIGYTPNALIGDYFFVDGAPAAGALGNVSGDPMVGLEFDERLNSEPAGSILADPKTFYDRYVSFPRFSGDSTLIDGTGPFGFGSVYVPYEFKFSGDGREPLGERFGFRFLNQAGALETWLVAWRSSVYRRNSTSTYGLVNLNLWLQDGGPKGGGFFDEYHALSVSTQDEDERQYLSSGAGCPSGDPDCQGSSTIPYIFLESQRIRLAGNREINPAGFAFGWIDIRMKTLPPPAGRYPYYSNMAWLGVEHSAAGQLISVGHAAHLLDGEFLCRPIGTNSRLFNPATIANPWNDLADANTRWYPGIQSLQFNRNANTNAPQGTYDFK